MKKIYFLISAFLVVLTTQAQDVITRDRDALMAFYNATNGSAWTDNSNWGSAQLVSTWEGVKVVNDRVTEITLFFNNLDGPIPPEIGDLDSLKHLRLYGNHIGEQFTPEICNLSALTRLDLGDNNLTDTIPPEIGNLSALEELSLGNNNLSGNIPPEIGNLNSLQTLGLTYNNLSGSIPPEIGNLSNLYQLDLPHNQLIGSIPPELGNLRLNRLDLAHNQLSGEIPNEMYNIDPNYLYLNHNQLTGEISPDISNITYLIDLYLNNNLLSGSIPPEIGNCNGLEELILSHNRLTGKIPPEIGNLYSLDSLDLSYNQLSDSIPIEIENITGLLRLNLSNNKLYGPLPDLSGLSFLSKISLDSNYCTFEAIEAGYSYPSLTTFGYIPQLNIPLTTNEILTDLGSNEDLDITILAIHNLGGANNRYQWFKDGVSITTPSASPVLSLASISAADFGVYTCQVTNTVVTDLTLYSEDILLKEDGPMAYSSSTTTQSYGSVSLGNVNQQIICVNIITSGTQAPLSLTNFSFNTNGSTDPMGDITTARLLYTKNNPNLMDSIQFAGDLAANGSFNFMGTQELSSGNNYFWLVYDISFSATSGNLVDAECNSFTISSTDYVPTITAPAGNNEIIINDWSALMIFYNATNGSNWYFSTNWGSTEPLGNWYGVYTNGHRVTEIFLDNNNLKGSIPPEIEYLESLVQLGLIYNNLSGSIPGTIGNLSDLATLDLSRNSLSGNIPDEISNLNELQFLDLSYNKLNGPLPDLSGITYFSWLILNTNYFTFEAIEAGLSYPSITTYEYIPQFNFQLTTNEILAVQGSNVDIDITGLAEQNLGGSNNRYQWFKDGVSITAPSASPILSLTSIAPADFVSYSCHVTNTTVTGLTIVSEAILLKENVPMVLSSVTTSQSSENVFHGDLNQKVIRVEISTTGNLTPLSITNFYFNTNGSTNASGDITAARLFYTGNNPKLADTIQFAGEVTANGYFSFSDAQELSSGDNYFWLVYDISSGATAENFVDAECDSIVVSSTKYVPVVTAPPGNNKITMGDRAALMALYNATDGPNWIDNTNWGSSEPLSNWYGVYVTNGRVDEIYLDENLLKGSIPPEIEYLDSIEYLSLPGNNLTGSIPSVIGNLTSLYELDFTNNQLSGTIPTEIGNLSNIEFIILSYNQFSGSIPVEFANLDSLIELGLNNNQLYGSIPDLSGMPNFDYLSLDSNYFTFEAIEAAYSFPYLMWYEYNPQFEVQLSPTDYIAAQGSNLDIDISSISLNNLGGSNNRYQWYKDGASITSPSASPVLSLTAIGLSDYGEYTCQITNTVVTDLTLYSEKIYIHETANNEPDVINPISDKTENEGFVSLMVDLTDVFTDIDGDILSYTAFSAIPTVVTTSIAGNTLTITEIGIGTTEIIVMASDGKGGSVQDIFIMNVNTLGNNAPVVANPISDKTENEGFGSFTVDLTSVFSDADGDILSYTALSVNTSVATTLISGNTLTINETGAGTTNITITAIDGNGGSVQDVFVMNIIAINNAPVVANPIGDKTENEGFGSLTVDLTNVFTDVDGDALSYSVISAGTTVATALVSGNTLTITEVGTGTTEITLTAIDGKGGSVNDAFTFTINLNTTIENPNAFKLKVYPNPTNGIIYFKELGTKIQNIKVYDLAGKLVVNVTGPEDEKIDLSGLNNGIYIVKISTDKESFTTRILKE